MTTAGSTVSCLLFEVAGCLMAIPASEVSSYTPIKGQTPFSQKKRLTPSLDLGVYFEGTQAEGPWLRWARGTCQAWLRVRRVIDVIPVSPAMLTAMPRLLRAGLRTRAFLAAGLREQEVFLLLDPAKLAFESPSTAGREP